MKRLTVPQIRRFRKTVYSHFSKHGRDLPWRKTKNPYHILVSEVMLQQTQVDRVIPKYKEFLKAFPTTRSLATASLSKILRTWSGLGYNRRAVALKKCAEEIMLAHKGRVPGTMEELDALSGIGHHTAGAIMAFSFNKPVIFIETNIRSIFIHHFFSRKKKIRDEELIPLIEQTINRKNPRKWYSALMDYGSSLKKQIVNPSRRSVHYTKQNRFEGSNRQLRGAILKLLIQKNATASELQKVSSFDITMIQLCFEQLEREGLIIRQKNTYQIAG